MDHLLFLPFTITSSSYYFLSLLAAFFMQLLLLSQVTSLSFSFVATPNTSFSNCLHHEKSALLQLKHGFFINRGHSNSSSKLDSWIPATDCCSWDGITCDEATGHVIGLDLYESIVWIEGRIDPSLFHLRSLPKLNLSWNYFPHPIPSGLGHLTNLTYLNLSFSSFTGQIPLEISKLTKLISLDLSSYSLKLKNPNLTTLIGNLSSLQELFLDEVNISKEHVGKWTQDLPITLPNLQRLSLRWCGLQGPIDTSLFRIPHLSQLSLDQNNLSIALPDFLGDSSTLTSLSLRGCGLYGKMPKSIFLMPNLKTLDISYNPHLTIDFPEFPRNKALQGLYMGNISFQKKLLDSIVNLKLLKELSLPNSNLSGSLPSSIANLTQLEYLDLSSNNFSGTIPRLIFGLMKLRDLSLSNNNFSGIISLDMFKNFKNFSSLDLSDNNLTIINNNRSPSLISSSQMYGLYLRSCNISEFPNILQNLNQLMFLDLSKNKISGEIPTWIWRVGNGSLYQLNLSNNFLESFEYPLHEFSSSSLRVIDLHSNILQGSLPILPHGVYFYDYSNNNLSSIIPTSINFTSTQYFFLSGNNVSGEIPISICKAHSLEILDLSRNNFSGNIPTCLGEIGNSLKILNLQRNSFQGTVPDIFKKECSLRTLNLDNNELEGPIPKSLANCKTLEVIDLGNNRLNDTFPFWFASLSYLRILILRSNKFHGPIAHSRAKNSSFQFLQIFDISFNSFSGIVPPNFFLNWELMAGGGGSNSSSNNQIVKYPIYVGNRIYYQDSVMVTMKGLILEVVKIITAMTSVDLSNNNFWGEIPKSIFNLKLLHVLNFSHNNLNGSIPASLEHLTALESLDLSRNKLSGEIPWQMSKLTFLEVLNLSQNFLFGKIPQSQQFLTFTNSSFLGNIGLCGPPLSTKCEDTMTTPQLTFSSLGLDGAGEIDLEFMWMGFGSGFAFGFGVIFWTLALWRRGRRKYLQLIDRMFVHTTH